MGDPPALFGGDASVSNCPAAAAVSTMVLLHPFLFRQLLYKLCTELYSDTRPALSKICRNGAAGGTAAVQLLAHHFEAEVTACATRKMSSSCSRSGAGGSRSRHEDFTEDRQNLRVIDRVYSLEEVVEATLYVGAGQKTGNVVLRVGEADRDEQR